MGSGSTTLPPEYRLDARVDLKEDRRVALAVQAIFVLVAGALIGLAVVADLPLATGWGTAVTIAVTVAACAAYMVVHELTHGVALRLVTGAPVTYAVRLPYLTTGSQAYLTRRSGIVVAVAPAVVWGVVLVALLLVVPGDLFLTAYAVLVLNFAGSAGDYVQAVGFARLPAAALIRDDGVETAVYLPA